jgi:hypothetical protein
MRKTTLFLIVSLALPAAARAQRNGDLKNGRAPLVTRGENAIGIIDGLSTVPSSARSFSVRASRRSSNEEGGRGISACAGRGEWKCVIGGAALGFVAGALIGHSLGPKPVEHRVSGDGFFGYYSYMKCDAHCNDQGKYVMPVGLGGALVGGVFGHYVAKWSSP